MASHDSKDADDRLQQLLDAVHDAGSFLDFARALTEDRHTAVRLEEQQPSSRYGPDAGGWENVTIEAFLSAAVSWAEDSEFGERMGIAGNAWRKSANFLYAGKFYE
jgi:hypothetical protein